jgi:hypothetical protein
MGMAQAFPVGTGGRPNGAAPLDERGAYLTQPAVMANLASPGGRIVVRTTLNFEAWTQRDGEITYGGWGEGFLDKRHPHTLVHEAMLSWNWWDAPGGAFSLSAGKGFAPYGSDDPMSRPAVKYPTNHHLSQVLERFTVNAVYLHRSGFGVEAGLFGGGEPTGPYDFSNIESFGNSYSLRLSQRLGDGFGPFAPWELSASYARVEEDHHGTASVTHLVNATLRHQQRHAFGDLYAMAEASRSEIAGPAEGYYALLGEARLGVGGTRRRHQPYVRVEYATRPEYRRDGVPGSDGFWTYDHDHAELVGATRWLINTLGYQVALGTPQLAMLPFIEVAYHRIDAERGDVDPAALFGRDAFWSVTTGFKLYLGGGQMRMGSYGVLDPMAVAMRPAGAGASQGDRAPSGHEDWHRVDW